jgi:nucleotide-binding universal stress UspA family protein
MAARLAVFNKTLPQVFHESQPIVAEGYPAEQILKTARDCQADIIIVGKTSRGLYQRVVLGTTSETVLQQAPCSVLIVPLREKP